MLNLIFRDNYSLFEIVAFIVIAKLFDDNWTVANSILTACLFLVVSMLSGIGRAVSESRTK